MIEVDLCTYMQVMLRIHGTHKVEGKKFGNSLKSFGFEEEAYSLFLKCRPLGWPRHLNLFSEFIGLPDERRKTTALSALDL